MIVLVKYTKTLRCVFKSTSKNYHIIFHLVLRMKKMHLVRGSDEVWQCHGSLRVRGTQLFCYICQAVSEATALVNDAF